MNTCEHEFVKGPFSLMATYTPDVPQWTYPQMEVSVEHCPKCGALRLTKEMRQHVGPVIEMPQRNQLSYRID